ncbi:hypothetical protein [uncultured Jannaschia sp.]|uniref:hypothetical protein n=1 Tax=uncultured Jannaschia sp. TaxID=293347 RepID=UPI00263980BA|nr:hypothetical protein [uncultured Jannaschia sp.]
MPERAKAKTDIRRSSVEDPIGSVRFALQSRIKGMRLQWIVMILRCHIAWRRDVFCSRRSRGLDLHWRTVEERAPPAGRPTLIRVEIRSAQEERTNHDLDFSFVFSPLFLVLDLPTGSRAMTAGVIPVSRYVMELSDPLCALGPRYRRRIILFRRRRRFRGKRRGPGVAT